MLSFLASYIRLTLCHKMNYILLIFATLLMDNTYSKSIRQVKSIASEGSASNEKRIVCYYTNWASSRSGKYQISPEDLDPFLCTHIHYAFVTLEEDVGLAPYNPDTDIDHDGFIKLTSLKKLNPNLKVMLSVGGSDEGSVRFSKMVSKPEFRRVFVKSARSFLMQYGFDGLDLVWQYPGFLQGSLPSDKENYLHLVKEIRLEFKDDFGLSMVVPKIDQLIKIGFDLPALTKYLDFINIVTYDYHDAREPIVNHVAPLYRFNKDPERSPNLNVDGTIMTYMKYGVDPAKITMGIPLYGVTYTLDDPKLTNFGSNTADEGEGNRERGALDYNVICDMMKYENWTVKYVNKSAVGPYAYRGNLWVGYDDEDMVRTKALYAAEKKLGGLMFWSIDKDDFRGLCGPKTYPLIKAGKEVFLEEIITKAGKEVIQEERMTTKSKVSPNIVQIIPRTINFPTATSPKSTRSTFSPRPDLSITTKIPDENVRDFKNDKKFDKKVNPLLDEPEINEHKNINTNRDIYLFKNFTISVTNNNCILKPSS